MNASSRGGELSAEDIEKVADEYFDTVHKVIHIDAVQAVVEEFYHVSHEDLDRPQALEGHRFRPTRRRILCPIRCASSAPPLSERSSVGRDHSTVLNSLKVVESKMKEDRRICDDLQQLKDQDRPSKS